MSDWKSPLDLFTLKFLENQLTQDRENHLTMAKEVKSYDEAAGEAFMLRAEECGRVINQLQKQIARMQADSVPPPKKPWP